MEIRVQADETNHLPEDKPNQPKGKHEEGQNDLPLFMTV
jgi:hypothetical protein